ncbi:unnamed protein product [Rotaria magnacalcarata]|uniref:F-box domain-containing protein n=2 Tax=Rotaria magnacalcarata TaxID=392030 RepID=A0A816YXP6_9BILA|nr:unnamed protein product [Rotaria magnacalcarata]CAF1591551.1 unnamed protein product [Rotaria magnacalcarata]CAF2173859.1 unnamed protein product [Rotaria magnacalcarata]
MNSISNLESLPDEILLELCKYLLCVDVLLSFDNLNTRMTCMINDYYHHVSLHKASYTQFSELCSTILPKIGAHIQTLIIDNCYSALQAIAFPKYFQNSMAECFPELQKITLISFRPDPLLAFLKILHNLEKLHTIDKRSLFRVPTNQQTEVLLALLQANNNRLKSVYIDDQSSPLNPIKKYLPKQITCSNIIDLKIEISTVCDLSVLLLILPNIITLSVSIHKKDNLDNINRIFPSYKLNFLTKFQLKSVERSWRLHELIILFEKLPTIKYLSLNLRTSDSTLTNGQILKTCLPNTIEEFHYAIHYLPEQTLEYFEILDTWKYKCPITCLYNNMQNDYMYLHTLPYSSFNYLEISSSVAESILKNKNSYENIQRIHVDCDFTLAEAFPILSYCRRVKHSMIWLHGTDTNNQLSGNSVARQTQQEKKNSLPIMLRLLRLTLVGSVPKDLHHMTKILLVAPNLFRLDLNYTTLFFLLDHEDACLLLQRRITALSINHMPHCSINGRQHISRIASIFLHLRHLYIDMRSLDKTIDLMVLCYFDEFSKQNAPLISLCADGRPSNEMKNDAEKWLIDHRNHLQHKQFTAYFNDKAGRLLIWM